MREAGAGTRGYMSAGERANETRLFREATKKRTQDNFEASARNEARSKANSEHNRKSVDHARAVQEQIAARPAAEAKPKNDLVIGSPSGEEPYLGIPKFKKEPGPGKPIKGPEGYPDPNGEESSIPRQIPTDQNPTLAPGQTQETVHIGTQKNHFTSDQPQKDPQAFADKYKLNLINKGMA